MPENGKPKGLTIQEILSRDKPVITAVPSPEWGGTVYVRSLQADQLDEIQARFAGEGVTAGLRAAVVAAALCDENGKSQRVGEAEMLALGKCSSLPVDRCFEVVNRTSGAANADVEAILGNSPNGKSDAT